MCIIPSPEIFNLSQNITCWIISASEDNMSNGKVSDDADEDKLEEKKLKIKRYSSSTMQVFIGDPIAPAFLA